MATTLEAIHLPTAAQQSTVYITCCRTGSEMPRDHSPAENMTKTVSGRRQRGHYHVPIGQCCRSAVYRLIDREMSQLPLHGRGGAEEPLMGVVPPLSGGGIPLFPVSLWHVFDIGPENVVSDHGACASISSGRQSATCDLSAQNELYSDASWELETL